MSRLVRIELHPLGETLHVEAGTPLQDLLFAYGVEFPCGGHGRCRGCRVKVLAGDLGLAGDEEDILTRQEIKAGWRLACRAVAEADVTLDIAQWETAILADDSQFYFTPRQGLGLAVDLGTTTLVVQLLDLSTAQVLGVVTGLNPQVAHGSDVMSRVQSALQPEGREKLMRLAREGIGRLIEAVLPHARAHGGPVRRVVIVGNTVMHHLFGDIDVEPLSRYPFETRGGGLLRFSASNLGWDIPGDPEVFVLPCLGGFVGSDVLAGIMATQLRESDPPAALIDLGTNGEIVLGRRGQLLCASTAAGPAFEGGRISAGMRATTGAISEVSIDDGALRCHVIGGGAARGVCGSGLVDAVASALDLGWIAASGRLHNNSRALSLAPAVRLTQADIRELQLAKAAIAAGIRILLERLAVGHQEVTCVYLAGAFGNYINRASARRIGMFDFPAETVKPSGNTALLGAKLALFAEENQLEFRDLRSRCEHMSLAAHSRFQEIYVDEMVFPSEPA